MVNALHHNEGRGVIFETEIKTLSKVLDNEWGDNRDVFMKAFHGEEISKLRIDEDKPIRIKNPILSVAISGTPSSFLKLLSDVEDGLYSRFCFYTFQCEPVFIDQFENSSDKLFHELSVATSSLLLQVYQRLSSRSQPLKFELSQQQQQSVVQVFSDTMRSVVDDGLVKMISSVKRAALICFRISGILSLLRLAGQNQLPANEVSEYTCSEDDLKAAILLSSSYLNHAIALSQRIPKMKSEVKLSKMTPKIKLYSSLPAAFTTQQYKQLAEQLGINTRTSEDYIREIEENSQITRVSRGHYQKGVTTEGGSNDVNNTAISDKK